MNKPVAYWDGKHFASKDKSSLADIPLYTHPVKELTDEEIDKAINYATMQGYGSSYIDGLSDGLEMVNAILRKAQEK